MVDHSHLSAGQSSSSCPSRDLYADFGVSKPNGSPSSDANGGVAACSLPCVSLNESEPSPQALSSSSVESCKDVNPISLNAPSSSDAKDLFIAAHHFAHHDRLEVVAERRKNLDLMSFLSAHGHSVQEVNDFVRHGSSSQARSDLHGLADSPLVHSQPEMNSLDACVGATSDHSPAAGVLSAAPSIAHLLSRGDPRASVFPDGTTLEVGEIPSLTELPPDISLFGHCPLDNSKVGHCPLDIIQTSGKQPLVSPFPAVAAEPFGRSLSPINLPLGSTQSADAYLNHVSAAAAHAAHDAAIPTNADVLSFPHPTSFPVLPPCPPVNSHPPFSLPSGSTPPLPEPCVVTPPPPITWSSLLAKGPPTSNLNLSYFPPSPSSSVSVSDSNSITILPPLDILKKGSDLWSSSLIGHFLHSKLPYKVVEPAAMRMWGKFGLQKVLLHEKGYYIFKFNEAADRDNVLALGPWYISNRLIKLQHWKEGVSLMQDVCTKTPVWVKLHHLPFSYWTVEGLGYVASGIGKPLFTDKITANLDPMPYARICVEMSIASPFPESLQVALLNEDSGEVMYSEVKVEYQNRPPTCLSCQSFGHSRLKCPKANYQWVPKSSHPPSTSLVSLNEVPAIHSPSAAQALHAPPAPSVSRIQPTSHGSEWIDVHAGPRAAKDKASNASLLSPALVSNPFHSIAIDPFEASDTDLTPSPNPLVSKLKSVDEKEGKDLKNKSRGGTMSHLNNPKKKNKGGGGSKTPSHPPSVL